jgi:hypothetical protein
MNLLVAMQGVDRINKVAQSVSGANRSPEHYEQRA